MTRDRSSVTEGLLVELSKEEALLAEAESELAGARVRYNVATRKYAAVRDMVTEHLDSSPYLESCPEWPMEAQKIRPADWGRWRFIHMEPGEAIVAALKEVSEPQTLEEIVDRLSRGRMRLAIPRVINAALMRTSGVGKTDDGKYWYQEPETEELPF